MAGKKRKRRAAFYKREKAGLYRTGKIFTGEAQEPEKEGGKEDGEASQEPKMSKRYGRKKIRETFGQNVQKMEGKEGSRRDFPEEKPEKSGAVQNKEGIFAGEVQEPEKEGRKEAGETFQEPKMSKRYGRKKIRETFGQNVQKMEGKEGSRRDFSEEKPEKSGAVQNKEGIFAGEVQEPEKEGRKEAGEAFQEPKMSKRYGRKKIRETFGQNVQKMEGKEGSRRDFPEEKPEKSGAVQNKEGIFAEETQEPEKEGRKEAGEAFQEPKMSKRYGRKKIRETFGQNVQKMEGKEGSRRDFPEEKPEKSGAVRNEEGIFAGEAQKQEKEGGREAGEDYREPKMSKRYGRKKIRETFGQSVQETGAEADQEKQGFSDGNSVFLEQTLPEQTEDLEGKPDAADDRRQEDACCRPQKQKECHRRHRQKENRRLTDDGQFQTGESVFEDAGGADFKETDRIGFTGSKKLQRKQEQAEKARKKAEKARAKLPRRREYTLQRVFDEETGRGTYVVVPVEREKPFREEGIARTAINRLKSGGSSFVHEKIAETEKENSAVEGAHKTEQRMEDAYGFVKRHDQRKGQRQRAKAARLEKKQFQKEASFQYQKFLEENPQLRKKALQKRLQKQRIKREYIKAGRKGSAMKAAREAVKKSGSASAVAGRLQRLAGESRGALAMAGMAAVLLVMVMSAISSCGAIFAGIQSAVLTGSYLSEPSEMDAAELQFTRLELDLQNEIDRIETDYPGYEEYSYELGEIGHNPFTLISYLSAIHTEFTADEVESEIQALFDGMYTLTLTPDTETRTRQVPVTDAYGSPLYDADGNIVMTEEEYEASVLRVELSVEPLESVVSQEMDAGQAETYAMYAETCGLVQEFTSPLDLYWHPCVSSYYGYRRNPDTGAEELHRGLDIEVPAGTAVYAAHDGTVAAAAYDSHYGNYVVLEKDGYVTKYAHLESLNVYTGQNIAEGTAIGIIGDAESHLHIECLYNGEYYNPLFYFDVG